ncbi:MAG: biotin/lipoyl-binding protein [Myxococcota bacterium]
MSGFRDIVRRFGPSSFLVAMIGTGAWLYSGIDPAFNLTGYSEAAEHHLSPARSGVVEAVYVRPGDMVERGTPLFRLVDPGIAAQIEIVQSELDRVRAAIRLAESETDVKSLDRSRALSADVESARAALAAEKARLAEAKAELEVVEREMKTLEKATASGFADREGTRELNVRRARAKETADASARTVAVLDSNLAAARARAKSGMSLSPEVAAGPLRQELLVLQSRESTLRQEFEGLTVRAPVDGLIGEVKVAIGEVASSVVDAVVLVDPDKRRLVVCVHERSHDVLEPDALIRFTRRYWDRSKMLGRVTAVDDRVQVLPERCQPGPATRSRGTLAYLNLESEALPRIGASYDVALLDDAEPSDLPFAAQSHPPAPPVTASSTVVPARESAIEHPITLPKALATRTDFELSGAVWVDELDAYVAVSDDTGRKGGDRRMPWVFALQSDGTVRPDPLRIEGIDEVDDLEDIARAEDGTLYLVTSHGETKSGKRRNSREQLLRVVVEDGSLRVTGTASLRALLEDAPPEHRAALGLTDGNFEVEGIDARDGKLYFGIKAPQAALWVLDDPANVFDGSATGADVVRRPLPPLEVPLADGATAAAGLAALRWGDSGELYVTLTPSDPSLDVDAGALVRITTDGDAERIAVFDGKPEALAWMPDAADELFIGFDAPPERTRFVTWGVGR